MEEREAIKYTTCVMIARSWGETWPENEPTGEDTALLLVYAYTLYYFE